MAFENCIKAKNKYDFIHNCSLAHLVMMAEKASPSTVNTTCPLGWLFCYGVYESKRQVYALRILRLLES